LRENGADFGAAVSERIALSLVEQKFLSPLSASTGVAEIT
jgi:hypothetical protein